jgi:ABC-type branched-subunit amino acid transport system ATPase component
VFDGRSIVGKKPYRIAREGIGRTFQQIRLFDHLSVVENVMVGFEPRLRSSYFAAMFGLRSVAFEDSATRAAALALLARGHGGLSAAPDKPAGALSYADKRRLEIVRALALSPKLLLLDEPAAGMAQEEIHGLVADLGELRGQGITILLVEHKMRLIEGVCDKVVVLDYGRKIAEGPFDTVKRDRRVVEAYLGRGYADAGAAAG